MAYKMKRLEVAAADTPIAAKLACRESQCTADSESSALRHKHAGLFTMHLTTAGETSTTDKIIPRSDD